MRASYPDHRPLSYVAWVRGYTKSTQGHYFYCRGVTSLCVLDYADARRGMWIIKLDARDKERVRFCLFYSFEP